MWSRCSAGIAQTGNCRRELSRRGGFQSARSLIRRTRDHRSLFESWTLVWIRCKQCFPAKNARTLRFKECAPLRSEKRRTILSPVEFQKETSVRLEKLRSDIVDEKFPIDRRPLDPFTVFVACYPMETNAMSSDEIEFSSKIRQGGLRPDSGDDAIDTEELSCAAKERFVVRVKAKSFVTEDTTEVQKITRAAAKIENLEWGRAIEPKILHALDVDTDPVCCVFVSINLSGIRSVRIALPQPL